MVFRMGRRSGCRKHYNKVLRKNLMIWMSGQKKGIKKRYGKEKERP